jgi:hypothetical protein
LDTNNDLLKVIDSIKIFLNAAKEYGAVNKKLRNNLYSLSVQLDDLAFKQNNYFVIKNDDAALYISKLIDAIDNQYFSSVWINKMLKFIKLIKAQMA